MGKTVISHRLTLAVALKDLFVALLRNSSETDLEQRACVWLHWYCVGGVRLSHLLAWLPLPLALLSLPILTSFFLGQRYCARSLLAELHSAAKKFSSRPKASDHDTMALAANGRANGGNATVAQRCVSPSRSRTVQSSSRGFAQEPSSHEYTAQQTDVPLGCKKSSWTS